jgi:hypothetical protein
MVKWQCGRVAVVAAPLLVVVRISKALLYGIAPLGLFTPGAPR